MIRKGESREKRDANADLLSKKKITTLKKTGEHLRKNNKGRAARTTNTTYYFSEETQTALKPEPTQTGKEANTQPQ